MSACDLMRYLLAAGFTLDATAGKLLVTPASSLTAAMREALRACKPELLVLLAGRDNPHAVVIQRCADCRHLSRTNTCLEPASAGLLTEAEGFGIAWPPATHAATCLAYGGKAPVQAQERPYKLTPAQGDAEHAEAWDDAAIACLQARVQHLVRMDFATDDADDLGERLTLRDRDGDDRRLCLECSWLAGAGRCLAAASGHLPDVDWRFEPVQTILQRCTAFRLRQGLD